MAGHFECVGFRLAHREQYANTVIDLVGRSAAPTPLRRVWADSCGALVVTFLEAGKIRCVKPSFRASLSRQVRATGLREDEAGCPFCSVATVEVVDDAGEMIYPLGIELDDIDSSGSRFEDGELLAVEITAFAETYRRWANVGEYDDDPARQAPGFASESLVPSGLFSAGIEDRSVRAEAIITGVVRSAEVLTNSLTGLRFQWAVVETFGGAYDIVVPVGDLPLTTGNALQATFWLVGHLSTQV